VLSRQDKIYSHSSSSFKQIKQGSKHACLVLFSSFCAVGAELTCGAHSLQDNVTSSSKFSNAIDSYHRVNLLYDGTINCFSTLALSSTASTETFTYKQALQEADYHEFVNVMIHEVDDHESRAHWTLTIRCELPLGTKTNNTLSFSNKSASALQLVVASVANKFSNGSTQPSANNSRQRRLFVTNLIKCRMEVNKTETNNSWQCRLFVDVLIDSWQQKCRMEIDETETNNFWQCRLFVNVSIDSW
jgi:hypothetical protein